MTTFLNIFNTIWNAIYRTCYANLNETERNTVASVALVIALILFVWSTKGSKKSQVVSNWFLFWVSMIALLISIAYFAL